MEVDRKGTLEMTIEQRIVDAGIDIPAYNPLPDHLPFQLFTRSGNTLYLSGHIPDTPGMEPIRGRLGDEVDIDTGREAARRVALNLLATLKHASGGLDAVARILKLTGFVASAPDFTQQPEVVNAASEMFVAAWGPEGLHARSAIGVAQLPLGVPVEIELIAELRGES